MPRLALLAGLAVLLAGCGGSRDVASDTAIAGNKDCGKKPDFVALEADASVTLCSANHDDAARRDGGTIVYTSAAAPAAVLAAAKAQAAKAGLAEQLSTPEMFSSAEGDRRTVMVMAAPQGAGSQVTVSWGRER
ncbi:MAG: hypothetical protein V4574_07620 [Pseudomonadota bacterium]